MNPETKKILLIGGAGLAGIVVIWYLLRSQGTAANQAVTSAGTQPLTVPTPGDITFNYPPLETTGATTAPPPAPACTSLCETCDNTASYAGTSIWRVSPGTVTSQYENLQSIGQQTGRVSATPFAGGFESTLPGGGPSFAEAYGVL